MKMRYFWLLDGEIQKHFDCQHHPGQENLGDYYSKAHTAKVHRHARPYYLHESNSPRKLVRALMPRARRGCVKPLKDSYLKRIPLPTLVSNVTRHLPLRAPL